MALSSRNAYLAEKEKTFAPTLFKALNKGAFTFNTTLGDRLQEDIEASTKETAQDREDLDARAYEAAKEVAAEGTSQFWTTFADLRIKEVEKSVAKWSAERPVIVQDMGSRVREAAEKIVKEAIEEAKKDGVEMKLDYISLNWSDTFEPVKDILDNE